MRKRDIEPGWLVSTFFRRFLLASLIWTLAWPLIWYLRIGDITGPKAWFWIIGELNYPVVAVAYALLDQLIERLGAKPWIVFTTTLAVIAACMPFYYHRYGFTLGVSLEARLF